MSEMLDIVFNHECPNCRGTNLAAAWLPGREPPGPEQASWACYDCGVIIKPVPLSQLQFEL